MELTTRQKNALAAKHITSPKQLRRWFPIRYIDNSAETGLSRELSGKHVVVIGELLGIEQKEMVQRSGKYISAKIRDRISGETARLRIFGAGWKYPSYCQMLGSTVIVCGTLSWHYIYGYNIDSVDTFSDRIDQNMRVVPVFSKIKGISDDTMHRILKKAVSMGEPETLPDWVLSKYKIPGINDAVSGLIYPESINAAASGDRRMFINDMFCLAGRFVLSERETKAGGISAPENSIAESVIRALPFALTEGQKNTYENIRKDMADGKRVRALVQGDVGCGKTVIAFLSMITAAENGYQSIMAAPTKVLAQQHYSKILPLAEKAGMKAVLIAGKAPTKAVLEKIESGEYSLIIGTHAVFSDAVKYHNPGLLVIDEEHKFGVVQREKITKRSSDMDVISMSATPMPRSLAGAVYGQSTQIYDVKTMPTGRKPVITKSGVQDGAFSYVESAIKEKHQVYVVCPAIDLDEGIMPGVLSVKEAAAMYRYRFPDARIAELDGDMKQDEIDSAIRKFSSGDIDILISTTIVEVGVDVPNASVMIIENAERFGLASMHQLRGRVGRGSIQSYCYLVCSEKENERVQAICSTNDGFKIAEMDMKELRLSGDLFGTEQSGYNKYVQEMIRYPKTYKEVLSDARKMDSQVLAAHIHSVLVSDTSKNNVLKKRR